MRKGAKQSNYHNLMKETKLNKENNIKEKI